jgi:hypothetical protein
MASAGAYDEWDDAGMAFTDEECSGYRPKVFAEKRVSAIGEAILVLMRREAIEGLPMPEWWHEVRQGLERIASWYCVSQEIPALALALPPSSSQEFKKLAAAAQKLDAESFVGQYLADAEANMRYVVTLGRRCMGNAKMSGWKKTDGKASNKLANCVMKERNFGEKIRGTLTARIG